MRAFLFPLASLFLVGAPRQGNLLASSPQRRMLLDLIRSRPGASVTELMAHVPFQWGSMSYHLNKMVEAGYIHIVPDPSDARRKRIYPLRAGAPDPAIVSPRDPQLNKLRLDIARAVVQHPGCDFADLTALLGIPPRTIHYHLKRLHEQELLVSGSPNRYRNLRPTPKLLEMLGEGDGDGVLERRVAP